MDDFLADVREAAALLRQARHAVVLTGAGISTPSGIPDFRSPGTGLWERVNPMEVASIHAFRADPAAFYRWMQPMVALMREAEPNPAHTALAQLEDAGVLQAVITQNIDGLHQRAGSHQVLELHGHIRRATCIECFRQQPTDDLIETVERGDVPRCPACGGVLKPNVILFGEALPVDVFITAMQHAQQADLLLVAGSSLTAAPASNIPYVVHEHHGRVIVVNKQETFASTFAAAVFQEDVTRVLPLLAQYCLEDEE